VVAAFIASPGLEDRALVSTDATCADCRAVSNLVDTAPIEALLIVPR